MVATTYSGQRKKETKSDDTHARTSPATTIPPGGGISRVLLEGREGFLARSASSSPIEDGHAVGAIDIANEYKVVRDPERRDIST